ncbi:MAG: hypothetical protein HRU20_23295 [Pseudomonadales bacterium]|nr:hypothetical protein [Pseudomonadales bacterium]
MLKLDLEYIASISLLRSDRWLHALLSPEDSKDISQLANSALLDYQNHTFRRDDNAAALSVVFDKADDLSYSLDFIQQWSNRFLLWKGTDFEVKSERLDEWQGLCSYIDPLLILAWVYAEKLWDGSLQPEQLAVMAQCPQALASDSANKHADNHTHLGGHGSHRKAIVDFSYSPYVVNPKQAQWPTLTEFTFLNAGLINKNELPSLLHALFSNLVERVLFDGKTPLPNFEDPISLRYKNDSLKAAIAIDDNSSVLQTIFKLATRVDTDKNCLLLYTGLFYAERYIIDDCEWKRGFRAYLHTTQILRGSMIHRGVGLGYFVEFFRHRTRKGASSGGYVKHSIAADMSSSVYREFKITPGEVDCKKLKKYGEYIFHANGKANLQLCLHFTRSGKRADKLQRNKRLALESERNRLIRLFSSFEAQHHRLKDTYGQDIGVSLNLLSLVRGLDVAGNENELPIEIFAPSLRVLRTCPWKNEHPDYIPPKRSHLSVHAGEDFQHLLSGLRHIDETITFCEMAQGDRVGHALALGVSPMLWSKRQGTVFIPAIEHLDNLVWLHHMVVNVAVHYSDVLPAVNTLSQRISMWCDLLYGKIYPPELLYSAWLLRRNCPVTYQKIKGGGAEHLKSLIPDLLEGHTLSEDVQSIWRSYFMSSHKSTHGGIASNFSKIVQIKHVKSGHPDETTNVKEGVDYFSERELVAMEAVQDYLMSRYDHRGIIIEACPSSNIYLGLFESYEEHPIFRWNPPNKKTLELLAENNKFGLRNGPVKLCINTDDAGLFPTTIANEHRVIKETAIMHYGVCSEDADIWIDRIRKVGVDEFERNREQLVQNVISA